VTNGKLHKTKAPAQPAKKAKRPTPAAKILTKPVIKPASRQSEK
jgi:hypothetical protein